MSEQQPAHAPMRKKNKIRLIIILAALVLAHLVFFAYPVFRICYWLQFSSLASLVIGLPLTLSQILSRWIMRVFKTKVTRTLRYLADFFMGISPVLLISVLCAESLIFFEFIEPNHAAVCSVIFSFSVGFFGIYKASFPIVKRVHLDSSMTKTNLRFVQISDVHIGSRSRKFLVKVIQQIRLLKPEFLAITGDFIDSSGIDANELISLKQLDCPIYLVIGNHERYEDLDQIIERLKSLGVIILRSSCCFPREDLQIIGIDDKDDPLQVEKELATLDIDQNIFSLLMYHRPMGFESAEKAGINLMISGHTHNGQIFPFNLIVRGVFRYLAGLYRGKTGSLYVSQGTGTWGPTMRIGSASEITLFDIQKV